MMLVDTFIDKSGIEGLGCFASETIKQGTLIWKHDAKWDVIFDENDLNELQDFQKNYIKKYAFRDKERFLGKWIFSIDNGRFWNHSANPNTVLVDFCYYAAKEIEIGEEITCDYREYDEDAKSYLK
jgi:SET domain-containing protein